MHLKIYTVSTLIILLKHWNKYGFILLTPYLQKIWKKMTQANLGHPKA